MKIRSIKFENHPVLGNLELDFTDKNGNTLNTIIIAGENGVGKSLLLHAIFDFSKNRLSSVRSNERRTYEIELSEIEGEILKSALSDQGYKDLIGNPTTCHVIVNYNIPDNWNQITVFGLPPQLINERLTQEKFNGGIFNGKAMTILKTIFSDVEINFTPREIGSVTATNIDQEIIESEKSGTELATQITQLIIDIQSLDALDFNEWAKENVGELIDESKIDIRMKRFTDAYHFMFPSKRFKRIDNSGNRKLVLFEENGRQMTIEQLSSGEKQIVFRGGFLLKDKESSKGALILIDEPEISLHPTWQLRILSFFKRLFTNETGEQTSQLIVATHSPFIIHNANRSEDKVIVLKKDSKGNTVVLEEPEFHGWSEVTAVHEAFNVIPFVEKSNKTIVFVEGETDEKYFNTCLQFFEKPPELEFFWIGRNNEQGNAENTGDTALNHAKTFFCANPHALMTRVILFYDNDTNKNEEDIGKLSIRRMMKNQSNNIFKIGIENLLVLPVDFDTSLFYKTTRKLNDYSEESTFSKLDKSALCSYICEKLPSNEKEIILANIIKEIERLGSEFI